MAEPVAAPLGRQLLRFIISGVIGLAVDVGVLYLAMGAGLGWFTGRAVSFVCAVWVTWQFNRKLTFTRRDNLAVWQEWWRYLSVMLLGGAVNYGIYSLVVLTAPQAPLLPLLAVGAGSLGGMSVNFVTARYLVFTRPGAP